MNDIEFAERVDYEGGAIAALEYGMTTSDLDNQDSNLATAWRRLEAAWEQFEPYLREAEDLVEGYVLK